MQPLGPEDITLDIESGKEVVTVKVYPSGPVSLESSSSEGGGILLSRDAWREVESHAAVGGEESTIRVDNASIRTKVTADGDGGVIVRQSDGLDVVRLSSGAVEAAASHVEETRFALQSRGYTDRPTQDEGDK